MMWFRPIHTLIDKDFDDEFLPKAKSDRAGGYYLEMDGLDAGYSGQCHAEVRASFVYPDAALRGYFGR